MTTSEALKALVGRLTLEQKVAQLGGLALPSLIAFDPRTGPALDTGRVAEMCPHGVGHLSLAWFLGQDADSLRDALAQVQTAVREASPFGIGGLVHFEGISGFLHAAGEQFPTPWAQAATWDPALTRRVAAATAAHMHDLGVHLVFAPVMDLSRDPRWGRTHETYGEDPEIAAQFSVAYVQGIQRNGDSDGSTTGLLATGKHFLGFAASEGGLNMATTQLGRRTLTDEYAEPFRRAIKEAGLVSVMNSYNEIDGVPAAANRWLLTELLREQLQFDGITVSDYESVDMLRTRYRTAATPGAAAVQALVAGLDAELPSARNFPSLVGEIAAGRLDERVVDQAVARVLAIKARAALIPEFRTTRASEPPRPDRDTAASTRRAIARRALVLLANDGTLPLAAGHTRVVVVGPGADEVRVHFGAYTSVAAAEMPAAVQAVRRGEIPGIDPVAFDSTAITTTPLPTLEPRFEEMARVLHPEARTVLAALRRHDPEVAFAPLGSFTEGGPEADTASITAAVGDADVVVAVVGERTGRVGANTAGEGRSTASPTLPGNQDRLLELLAATGKPVVTVVVSGRPLILERAARASAALVLAPLLGEVAGDVVAAAVFGTIDPSGKLPGTLPRHPGQIPAYHGHRHGSGYDHPTGDTYEYVDLADQTPLFAFGHGLSFTSFDVAFHGRVGLRDDHLHVPVTVTNTGPTDGETVVQVYVRQEFASVVRPVRQLLQFRRLALAAGTSTTAVLTAPVERLCHTLPDGRRGVEAGHLTVMVGLAADDIRDTATVAIPETKATT